MTLTVRGLAKHYATAREQRAVDDVGFDVIEGELFTLLGPSGCGKTTTLRCIAGLEDPDAGRIDLDERVLFDSARHVNVPSNDRHLAMVFQSYAIWPHMSVYRNVAFPIESLPRHERPSRSAIRERVDRALTSVGLQGYESRPGTALSGGQQQRLALARALASEPSVVLLDEPLSNLDPKLRANLRLELKRMQRDANVTAVYVTHDQAEALSLSNHIAVMDAGHIKQIGKPRDIYSVPNSRFVADFLGAANFVDAEIVARGDGSAHVKTELGVLRSSQISDQLDPGENRVCVCLRPEHLMFVTPTGPPPTQNRIDAKLLTTAFLGDSMDLVVYVAGIELRVRCSPDVSIRRSEALSLSVDPDHVLLLPRE